VAGRPAGHLLALALGLLLLAWPAPLAAQSDPAGPSRRATRMTSAGTADARANRGALQPRCARCHGEDGKGRRERDSLSEIPDFSNHKWQTSRTDAQLLVSILDGKGKHMPGYRGKLSENEARDMVAQVRDFDPAQAVRQVADPPGDDFARRFKELQDELEELKKRFRELSPGPRKP
jgi:mono/diheme cytochrome c family protein